MKKHPITREYIAECLKQTPLSDEYCVIQMARTNAEYSIKVGKKLSIDLYIDELPYGGSFRDEIKGITTFEEVVNIIYKHETTTKAEKILKYNQHTLTSVDDYIFVSLCVSLTTVGIGELLGQLVGYEILDILEDTEDTTKQYIVCSDHSVFIRTLDGTFSKRLVVAYIGQTEDVFDTHFTIDRWQNTGMFKQPIIERVTNNGSRCDSKDIIVRSYNNEWLFRCHQMTNGTAVVDFLDSRLVFTDTLEEDGFSALENATSFAKMVCELFADGKVVVYTYITQFKQMVAENCILDDIVITEEYDSCDHCEYTVAYTKDEARKCHINQDCSYAFSRESAEELVAEGYVTNFRMEEVYMQYPNGDVDIDYRIVCYKPTEE